MVSRRGILAAGGLSCLGGAGFLALGGQDMFYAALRESVDGAELSAPEAYRLARAGRITLVDIRRPDEWAATGSGAGARRLDLRRVDFVAALAMALDGDRSAPVALICARGVRSARTANRLRDAGFTDVVDVPEGMLGAAAGPGWIARALPLNRAPVVPR